MMINGFVLMIAISLIAIIIPLLVIAILSMILAIPSSIITILSMLIAFPSLIIAVSSLLTAIPSLIITIPLLLIIIPNNNMAIIFARTVIMGATKGFVVTTKGFVVATKGFSVATKGFVVVTKGFSVATKGFVAATKPFVAPIIAIMLNGIVIPVKKIMILGKETIITDIGIAFMKNNNGIMVDEIMKIWKGMGIRVHRIGLSGNGINKSFHDSGIRYKGIWYKKTYDFIMMEEIDKSRNDFREYTFIQLYPIPLYLSNYKKINQEMI
jgi:hypothetical protein